ncbi:MAG: hypothetical protein Q8P51_17375, partial [Ignavibacteria bacterium]|nr:hypothetical protein [Ignavibacteria bacterium]
RTERSESVEINHSEWLEGGAKRSERLSRGVIAQGSLWRGGMKRCRQLRISMWRHEAARACEHYRMSRAGA